MWWSPLIHLGDLPLTMGAAAAIAMWLLAARAWRLAVCWSMLFALAIGVVAVSKIAFLVRGVGVPELDFRAVSGHATGVTAIAITTFYLALRRSQLATRLLGVACGVGVGAAMVAMLVAHEDHSLSEAIAGWLIGASVGLGVVWIAHGEPLARVPSSLALAVAAFVGSVWVLRQLPIGYLMVKLARAFVHHASGMAVAGS